MTLCDHTGCTDKYCIRNYKEQYRLEPGPKQVDPQWYRGCTFINKNIEGKKDDKYIHNDSFVGPHNIS